MRTSLLTLLLVASVTSEGTWCKHNCIDVTKFEVAEANYLEVIPLDFEHPECKVMQCEEGKKCNSVTTTLSGLAGFQEHDSPESFVMNVEMTMCDQWEKGHVLTGCVDHMGVLYKEMFKQANDDSVIDMKFKQLDSAKCSPVDVCTEDCVPETCLPQDKDKDKERYENSATCSTVSALLVSGIFLH